ncbi:hypothetical protein ES703_17503 [subsurface metagenome]
MEQSVLITEACELINQAVTEQGFGRPDDAQASLVKLRELLNAEPELEAGGDQVIEEKLNPNDG